MPLKPCAATRKYFQRNHQLVQVIRTPEAKEGEGIKRERGSPLIRTVQPPTLREIVTCVARWRAFKTDRSGNTRIVNAHPPAWSVNDDPGRGQWAGIRHLVGVVEVPTSRRDESVIEEPGYDDATGLLYLPTGDFPSVP